MIDFNITIIILTQSLDQGSMSHMGFPVEEREKAF